LHTIKKRYKFLSLAILTLFLLILLQAVNAQGSSITGQVFIDGNDDGLFDPGERAVEGADLSLIRKDEQSEQIVALAKSDTTGSYTFDNVQPGTHYLRIHLNDGLIFIAPVESGSAALPAAGSTSRTASFNLGEGEQKRILIGAGRNNAFINITAFEDENMNGGRFSSEPLIRNVSLSLIFEWQGEQHIVAEAVTDKDGFAQMRELTPGSYRLAARLPDPYIIGPVGAKVNPFYNVVYPTQANEGISEPFLLERSLGLGVGGVKSGSLSGRVWHDTNMNGALEADEGGYPGIALTLLHLDTGLSRSLVTQGDAPFRFDYLQGGKYILSAALPDGVMFSLEGSPSMFQDGFKAEMSTTVQVQEGIETRLDPIGVMPASSVTVIAYHDADVDGIPDEGEPAFAGAKVEALDNEQVVSSVVTDGSGIAVLPRVRSGSVVIRVTLPDGQIFSVGNEAGNAFHSPVAQSSITVVKALQPGEGMTLYAGATLPASISGTLFEDSNLSGVHEGSESFLSGFTVQAVDTNGGITAETTTGAEGKYRLENLVPTSYSVRFVLTSPYVFSDFSRTGAPMENKAASQTPAYGQTETLTLSHGENIEHIDAGAFRSAVINGSILLGDEEEAFSGSIGGLSGVRVELLDENGTEVSVYTVAGSGQDGRFSLKGALPGIYRLRYSLPENTKFSAPLRDDINFVSDTFSIIASEVLDLAPLYAVKTGSISGVAFHDVDNDGAMSPADTLLAGVQIKLVNNRTGEEYSTASGADGVYALSGIRPGLYSMTVTLQEGFSLDANERGLVPASLSGVSTKTLQVHMADKLEGTVLAAVKPLSLNGISFYDNDLSQRYEERIDKPYQTQLILTHLRTGTKFNPMADALGNFSQATIFPGRYELRMQLPEDHILSLPGNAMREGNTWIADVLIDQVQPRLELAFIQWGSLEGSVWNMDGGNTDVSGIAVELLNKQGETVQTTVTDEAGYFTFLKLLPVDYALRVKLEGNFRFARVIDTTQRPSMITADTAGEDSTLGTSGLIPLSMGEGKKAQDIGIGAMGKLGDYAWLDLDHDGMQDAGEPGIPGIGITLIQYGKPVAQTVTDEYGRYGFGKVYPGTYVIEVNLPEEIKPTVRQDEFPLVASILGASDTSTARSGEILIPSGRRNLNGDLGFVLTKEGRLPESMQNLPSKDWTGVNEQKPKR
jgi:hypothetical protein